MVSNVALGNKDTFDNINKIRYNAHYDIDYNT